MAVSMDFILCNAFLNEFLLLKLTRFCSFSSLLPRFANDLTKNGKVRQHLLQILETFPKKHPQVSPKKEEGEEKNIRR